MNPEYGNHYDDLIKFITGLDESEGDSHSGINFNLEMLKSLYGEYSGDTIKLKKKKVEHFTDEEDLFEIK